MICAISDLIKELMEHGYVYIYISVYVHMMYIYIYIHICSLYGIFTNMTPKVGKYSTHSIHGAYGNIMKYPICAHFVPCRKLTSTLSALTASNSRRIRWLSMLATSACCLEHQISGWGEPERQNVPFSSWNKGVLQFFWVKQLWDCCTNMCTYVHSDQALPSACDPK